MVDTIPKFRQFSRALNYGFKFWKEELWVQLPKIDRVKLVDFHVMEIMKFNLF